MQLQGRNSRPGVHHHSKAAGCCPRVATAAAAAAPRTQPSQHHHNHQQHHQQQQQQQQYLRQQVACSACAAAAVDSSRLVVGYATPEQYFPAADLHTACFHDPCPSPNDRLWKVFDRIWGLQVNASLARRGAGRCALLLAFDPDKANPEALAAALAAAEAAAAAEASKNGSSSSSSGNGVHRTGSSSSSSSSSGSSSSSSGFAGSLKLPADFTFPRYGYWLSRLVDRTVWPGLGTSHEELGIVGVAQVDTFGDIIPPRTLSPQRDGAWGWVPRDGYAYICNVAVSPSAQRCGVATRLMAEAEAVAASWGCSKAGLHVNMTNTPALGLYRSLSYKKGALEAPWMPYLQGRAPERCMLMLKRLSPSQQQQQQEQQEQQQQLGSLAAVASSSSSSSSSEPAPAAQL